MPILPTVMKFLGKQLLKTGGKKAFSGATGIDLGTKPLNENEDETVNLLREYQNPNSPIAQNVSEMDFVHEIPDRNSPLYKDISDWINADLARAYDSPLYKYNKKLQDKTREYIQTKWK
ncbi:MAG: hypothetical protein II830_02145 [Alphaproteobacteria bacterium]|nr:hypothetical protein [Alphaproteobacteria bacterium]